jgi:acetyl-CoA C-acetyltransferase
MVLASAEKAKSITDKPVWILGMGWATDTYYMGERDLSFMDSLHIASTSAYSAANIKNPLDSIDVAEISDHSSYRELMAYEALGFCEKGRAAEMMEEGTTAFEGKLPVNASGGALSGSPFFAVGLIRLAEAAIQIRGDAGEHQIKGAKVALAQGSYGFCGQGNSVFILGA